MLRSMLLKPAFLLFLSSRSRGCVANSSIYPFALSSSKGSERIAIQSPMGEGRVRVKSRETDTVSN
jgi:hypothetical protein